MKSRTTAITAVGVLMFANGLLIGAPWLISEWTSATEVTFLDSVADWRYVAFNYLYLAALIAFITAAPTLTSWVGRDGRTLPNWLVPVMAAAAALQACTLYTQAVVSPFLLEIAPIALTTEDGGAFAISMSAIWVVWIAALTTLAIIGWRRKVMPMPAALLMIVGSLVIPIFGAIGSILVGAALAWTAWSHRVSVARRPVGAVA
jgi:MFS family permease